MDADHSHYLLNGLGLIVGVAIFSRWLAWKLKIPAIILLILVGLAVGPIFGLVNPKELLGDLFYPLIELAVVIILFEGGLNLRFHEFKSIASGIKRLISIGLVLNWALGACAAHYIAHLSWPISAVLGAILVVTGPTVILPAIRHAKLNQRVGQYLKWEGIINDPLGVLIATLVFEFIIFHGNSSFEFIIASLVKVLFISSILTVIFGFGLEYLIRKSLIPDFLKIPTVLSALIVLFVLSTNIQEGSGLLAATLLGILLGNQDMKFSTELSKFKESISVFAIAIVFILLSASLDFSILKNLNLNIILFIVIISFIIRPLSLMLSTIGSNMTIKERILVANFGPRGIVAASMAGVLSAQLASKGFEEAELILPIVFSIVFLTVFVSGFSLHFLAKWLKLSVKNSQGLVLVGASPWSIEFASMLKELKIPVMISDASNKKLIEARKRGIDVHYGQILTDLDEGKFDFAKFNYVFALTHNDSYNALVCEKLSEDFERTNLFQLPIHDDTNAPLEELPESIGGTPLNRSKALYENLIRGHYEGWHFWSETISEDFSYKDLNKKINSHQAIHLLVLHKDKSLSFLCTKNQVELKHGDLVISYGPSQI